jgi:hypothetical protein
MYIYLFLYFYISIYFVYPVVDTTLLYVCTLWLGILFTNCSPSDLDTTQSIGCVQIISWCERYILLHLSLSDKLTHLCSAWVGTIANRELEDNYYSEEVQKGWKEARCSGFWSVEVDLFRAIEGKGWRW